MRPIGAGGVSSTVVGVFTDTEGRAGVDVELGRRVGSAGVRISIPSLGFTDSLLFGVTPASIVNFTVDPRDSTACVGNTLQLRVSAVDLFSNPTIKAVTYSADGSGLTIDSYRTVHTRRVGRFPVAATVDTFRIDFYITIVPDGMLGAIEDPQTGGRWYSVVNLDGSGARRLTNAVGAAGPAWNPAGDRVVYGGSGVGLWTVDLAGTTQSIARSARIPCWG